MFCQVNYQQIFQDGQKQKYLLLEQWQWPEDETFPETAPETAASWHLFRWEDRGGLPAETVGAGAVSSGPIFPSETLPSPVIEDINDDVVDMGGDKLKVSLENSQTDKSAEDFGFDFTTLGFTKSRVKPWEDCDWTELRLNSCSTRVRVGLGWDRAEAEDWLEGARRNRAWPDRFNKLITCLNLETVKSVISLQSIWFRCGWSGRQAWEGGWEERKRIRWSMLFNPAEAASCMAICSSILGGPTWSTAINEENQKMKRKKESVLLTRERWKKEGGEGL